ncbi:MAG: YIP1 family protein [Gemmatimonadota bacterium]
MSSTAPFPGSPPSLLSDLIELVRRPERVYPRLFARGRAASVLAFSAVSGIYVAYAIAGWLDLGDAIGFWPTVLLILPAGTLLGFLALYFAGGLLSWSAEALRGREETTERMYAVFGYATWPFLPLLLIIVPIEFALYGTFLFSEVQPPAPAAAVWAVRLLEVATIGLWLYLMIKGTAAAARESDVEAAETVALTLVEIAVIGILFFLILLVSLLYW